MMMMKKKKKKKKKSIESVLVPGHSGVLDIDSLVFLVYRQRN